MAQGAGQFQNREHFVAICAQLMRQILVEYARSRNAAKRDGGYRLFSFTRPGISVHRLREYPCAACDKVAFIVAEV